MQSCLSHACYAIPTQSQAASNVIVPSAPPEKHRLIQRDIDVPGPFPVRLCPRGRKKLKKAFFMAKLYSYNWLTAPKCPAEESLQDIHSGWVQAGCSRIALQGGVGKTSAE